MKNVYKVRRFLLYIMKKEIELKTIKVSQKGQISIPSDIRKEIGIK
jgi:hypothetical protein